ncbi:MAG TPA: FAD/NAD(P)-binding oxidoreductase [Acidimicrobiia bacterium]|nr:FAD/NAD(P)-binding oxidoreductase [Acidimicrobiia bacterium]
MKRLVVLGAGTAGTMIANSLVRRLPADWEIEVIDPAWTHLYQPGLLFVPFGEQNPSDLVRPIDGLLPESVTLTRGEVDRIDTDARRVLLEDGAAVPYDQLVIATGTRPRPEMTPGLTDHGWRETVHEFYTLAGASALREALARFEGGRLVVHIAELPIKCPVAPLEFAFLADDHFRKRRMRELVDIVFVTPLSGAFTKPIAAEKLGGMLEARGIVVEPDFMVESVDDGALVSYDERRISYDLLVTVPVNMGEAFVGRSGLGDELDHVRVDPHTFLAAGHDDIFAIGDAAALPTSKAGSTAHFAVEVFVDNFVEHIAGEPMSHSFDGHANCFVEAGGGKALLIDFNYDTEPLPGVYPVPGLGPLHLLEETRLNHWAKLAFETVYWRMLLPGHPLPVPNAMSMAGKVRPEREELNV